MANKNLTKARNAKNDEFYTQFSDIQKEVESYLEYNQNTFKGKVVYSNCDDPFESNFFRYGHYRRFIHYHCHCEKSDDVDY